MGVRSKWCGARRCGARGPRRPKATLTRLGEAVERPRLPSCAPTQSQVSGDHLRVTWAGPDRRHSAQRAPERAGDRRAGPRAAAATALPGPGQLVGGRAGSALAPTGWPAGIDTHPHPAQARAYTHTHTQTHAQTHAPTATKRVCCREARSRGALGRGRDLRGRRLCAWRVPSARAAPAPLPAPAASRPAPAAPRLASGCAVNPRSPRPAARRARPSARPSAVA